MSTIIHRNDEDDYFSRRRYYTKKYRKANTQFAHHDDKEDAIQKSILERARHNSFLSVLHGNAREDLVADVLSQMVDDGRIIHFFRTTKGDQNDRKGIDFFVVCANCFYSLSVMGPFDILHEKEKYPHVHCIALNLNHNEAFLRLFIEEQIEQMIFASLRKEKIESALSALMSEGSIFRYRKGIWFTFEKKATHSHYEIISMREHKTFMFVFAHTQWDKNMCKRYPSAHLIVVDLMRNSAIDYIKSEILKTVPQ